MVTKIRCGDHVKHGPSGETWVVAYVNGEHLAWCGYPEGEAKLADCTLVKTASDYDHFELTIALADSKHDLRGRRARASIDAFDATRPPGTPTFRERHAALLRIKERLGNWYGGPDVWTWLKAPQAQLGGAVAIDLIYAGEGATVEAVLDRLDAGAYI